ncbi:MAG TPA: hypothetical protein PLH11_07985 [Gemmobacter sp.]|nr:hypothetical protein [Gemmobacter sp.]
MSTIGALSASNPSHMPSSAAIAPQGAETSAQGQAAPAESRSQAVQARAAREMEQEPRNPAPQLLAQQAATEVVRLAVAQAAVQAAAQRNASDTEDTAEVSGIRGEGLRGEELKIKAVRAYEETTQVLDEAKALIDRIVLLPEKGDLSLEASQMPPYGPPPGPPSAAQPAELDVKPG